MDEHGSMGTFDQTYLIYEAVKETLVMTISGPCRKDWDSFASSVGPGHHNPYRAASHGRVVRLWDNRENAVDNHAACLSVRLYVSTPLVAVAGSFSEDLSRTLVVATVDEIVHRVWGHMCPRLVQRTNRPEAVDRARKMLCGRGQSVLDGGEVTACRRRVSQSQASEASQTCQ